MLGLFIQSSISKLELPDLGINWFDKVLHFVVFGILGLLTTRGFLQMKSDIFRENYAILGMLVCIIYGAIDEIHQLWVPGRHASVWDWVADTLGIIVFVWIFTLQLKSRAKKIDIGR
jgi:VanZ family protein